jgi:hypothetical protein
VSKGEEMQSSGADRIPPKAESAPETSAAHKEVYSERSRAGTAGTASDREAAHRQLLAEKIQAEKSHGAAGEKHSMLNGFSLANDSKPAGDGATQVSDQTQQSISQAGKLYSKVLTDAHTKMSAEGFKSFVEECRTKLSSNPNENVVPFFTTALADLQRNGLSQKDAVALGTIINSDVKAGAVDLAAVAAATVPHKPEQAADHGALGDRTKVDAPCKNALNDASHYMSVEGYKSLVTELETQLKANPNQTDVTLFKTALANLQKNGLSQRDAASLALVINHNIKAGTVNLADVIRK